MKLLLCPVCHDVEALHFHEVTCGCGASSGRYVDQIMAEAKGKALILGIANQGLYEAIHLREYRYPGDNITVACWIMGEPHLHVTYRRDGAMTVG